MKFTKGGMGFRSSQNTGKINANMALTGGAQTLVFLWVEIPNLSLTN